MQVHEPVPLNATEKVSCCHYTVYCIYLMTSIQMDFIGMGKVYTDRIIICNQICPSNGWDRERARELTNELREETVLAWKKKKAVNQSKIQYYVLTVSQWLHFKTLINMPIPLETTSWIWSESSQSARFTLPAVLLSALPVSVCACVQPHPQSNRHTDLQT